MNFNDFQLHTRIAAGITVAGYSSPTPIQIKAIPEVMQGRDLIGLAQTGTGKTAAYALPLLHRLLKTPDKKTNVRKISTPEIRALILAPTRELAEQIHQDIKTLGVQSRLRSLTLYGGVSINSQIERLKAGAEIIVACPGRLIDHINRGNVDFSALEVLILDEADQMLDMGFIPDIRRIMKRLPRVRQTLMFSATMRHEIRQLADEILSRPVTVKVGDTAPADTVSHTHFPVTQNRKTHLLLKILKDTQIGAVLVFTRTKHRAKRLSEVLHREGYKATSLQGNLSQPRRQDALNGFRSGKYQILVATDIAARGIDISKVSHVVNYDIPDTAETYIHRIGRTGRAANQGKAFNLVTSEDKVILHAIDRMLGELVERRTLPDFDYDSSGGQLAPQVLHSKKPGHYFHRSMR